MLVSRKYWVYSAFEYLDNTHFWLFLGLRFTPQSPQDVAGEAILLINLFLGGCFEHTKRL